MRSILLNASRTLLQQLRPNAKKIPVRWLTLASGLVSVWLAAWQAAVWRDTHSYLPHVLVGAQEALDVTEHLGNRHFSQTVEAALRR